ncbi:hypothetical protein LTT66_18210 [Nocardia gipuzkoensis]|uniref:hypothetical protein n=1 Tax=Nocardia gipuzkoensis TaxID=2749991 RepID=UPI001E5DC0FE|nr:hypothetical protein [Nocardia gipuzkoensis]UGT65304.1 hypothetical protein LTT66_18210 [Nocardia gipuzkoensis]
MSDSLTRRLWDVASILARFFWRCMRTGGWYFGRTGAALFALVIAATAAAGISEGRPALSLVPVVVVLVAYPVVGLFCLGYPERYEETVGRARQLAAAMSTDSARPASTLARESGVNVGAAVALLWRMEARGWAEDSPGGYRLTRKGMRAFAKPRVSL